MFLTENDKLKAEKERRKLERENLEYKTLTIDVFCSIITNGKKINFGQRITPEYRKNLNKET